ncbi:methyl-accepting chemotaxis protein [Aquitalea aquatilis]|uniref:methyl-accepting chemotaxis protein n=1 Tax=Aquitalea aquatilis TaxID=1537400 RepID=UPI0010BD02AC|nr:methyl-accepting chemotaxis protein [Aquitalea aquatilis]
MTVARRIIIQITLAIIAIIGITSFSVYTQKKLADTARKFSTVDYPNLITLNKLSQATGQLRVDTMQYLLSTTSDERAESKVSMSKSYTIAKSFLTDYERMIKNEEDRIDFNENKEKLETYYKKITPAMIAVEKGDLNLAIKIRKEQIVPAAKELFLAIEKHINYNKKYVESEATQANQQALIAKNISILVSILSAIVLILSGLRTFSSIIKPLNELKITMTEIQENLDFTKKVTIIYRQDEVGKTAIAFNKLISEINSSLRHISETCKKVSSYSSDLAKTAINVSQAASNQNEASASIATTMEELTVSINHVGTRANKTSEKTNEANKLAEIGQAVIGKTVQDIRSIHATVSNTTNSIKALEHENSRVASAVDSIKDIAEQTNLLALNAAIEAARAGEQGRGFAVVADEVRKLAERTTSLTSEINNIIKSITTASRQSVEAMAKTQNLVEAGVKGADNALQSIEQIDSASSDAKEMVSEITDAIREQATASTSIAVQVEQIAQMAEKSSDAARKTESTANKLDLAVISMTEAVRKYQL